jgi:hypothetical protein
MINLTSLRNYTLLSLPPITAAEEMTSARPAYDFISVETETTETTNQTLARHDVRRLFRNVAKQSLNTICGQLFKKIMFTDDRHARTP